jgi:hypothetical protein
MDTANYGANLVQNEIETACMTCDPPALRTFGNPVYADLEVTRTSDECGHTLVRPKIVQVKPSEGTEI